MKIATYIKVLIPTKEQFKNWSLPSKVTYISGWVGVLGILLSVLFFLLSPNYEEPITKLIKLNSDLTEEKANLLRALVACKLQNEALTQSLSCANSSNLSEEEVASFATKVEKTSRNQLELGHAKFLLGNTKEAIKQWKIAAKKGDQDAQFYLGALFQQIGNEESLAESIYWYEQAAGQGNPKALTNLGHIYQKGIGVTVDLKKAMDYYQKAAMLKDERAQANLGNMYQNGLGVTVDYEKAFHWNTKAAKKNVAAAQVNLGLVYRNGLGKKIDYQQAFDWFTKAANQSDAAGQLNIGFMYFEGLGRAVNYKSAFDWYSKAANQGFDPAQVHLANLYHKGIGQPANWEKAIFWYEKAATQGNSDAQTSLGNLYFDQNEFKKSFDWYAIAAKGGDQVAQMNLGMAYQLGNGVRSSKKEALRWFLKSAKQGYPPAMRIFSGLSLSEIKDIEFESLADKNFSQE
ncbi:MAG: hypothetical protein AB8G15_21800 [Saprospiraceae bacterium]